MRSSGIFILTAALALFCPRHALAVEGGMSPYAKGIAGFMGGFVPPQEGFYLSDIFYYFHGSVDAEVRNGRAEFNVGTHADIDLLQGTYVSGWHILGGRYAAGAALTYLDVGLSATVAGPAGTNNVKVHSGGISDSLINPITLGWDSGDLHWSTALLIYAPTGVYHNGQLNVGKNIWAFMPQAALTWYDPKSGWDVSGTLTYVTMTRNDATDYQSGDILHFDWGIGLHFGAKQEWEAGINGSIMEQVSGDSGTGAVLGPLKAESFGIGPALSYRTEWGKTPLAFSAKWESDFYARRTFSGDIFIISATAVF